jgi:hypothetical protein
MYHICPKLGSQVIKTELKEELSQLRQKGYNIKTYGLKMCQSASNFLPKSYIITYIKTCYWQNPKKLLPKF